MKSYLYSLALLTATTFFGCNSIINDHSQTVNPILGDISFEKKFGYKPDARTDNGLRVKTHLEYVEHLLRNKGASGLTTEMRVKRHHILDLLHKYWQAGVFPKNYDYPNQRKPCFIDKNGTICAVGFLIEQTASRKVANEINSKHKYKELMAMNDKTIDRWVGGSGLTKEECAMIQPTYGPPPVTINNHITTAYGISSSLLCGLNLSLTTVNGIEIAKGGSVKAAPAFGLLTGAVQLVIGTAKYPKDVRSLGTTITNNSQKTLSMLNIGLGTSTMILSLCNLITNSTPKEKSTSWHVYTYPAQSNRNGLAISLEKKF